MLRYPPPKIAISLTNVSRLPNTRKDAMKTILSYVFLFAKDYRPVTLGWQGAPYFRRNGRGLVSKPAISLNTSWGGYRRTTPTHRLSFPARSPPPPPPLRLVQTHAPTPFKVPPSPHRLCDLQGTIDKLMHFLPQLSDFVPLKKGLYSFRAQTA